MNIQIFQDKKEDSFDKPTCTHTHTDTDTHRHTHTHTHTHRHTQTHTHAHTQFGFFCRLWGAPLSPHVYSTLTRFCFTFVVMCILSVHQ